MQRPRDPDIRSIGERVSALSLTALTPNRSPQGTSELISKLDLLLDQQIERFANLEPVAIACRDGCNFCCYRVVPSSVAEVARVADFVRETYSEQEQEALAGRLASYERQVASSFGFDLEGLRPQCPMLQGGRCSIYEVRPLACRGKNSFDAQACEQSKDRPEALVGVPSSPKVDGLSSATQHALNDALGRVGVVNVPHDFGRALKIALEEPEAVTQWLAGGLDFLPAVAKSSPQEPQPPPPANPIHRSYRPNEEPTGHLDLSGLMLPEYLAMTKGDSLAALKASKGSHPADLFFRARVPITYRSEDEVLDWRAHFEKSIRELLVAKFDAKQAYDGLVAFRSHELIYQQFNNRDLLALAGDLLCNKVAARALPELCRPIDGPRRPGPIRVGYISANLRASSAAPWALGWLKNQSKDFETFAIHLGDFEDQVSLEFQQLATHYFHMPRRAPVPVEARFIRGLDLDVLIYLEVGTTMRNGQLAVLRLARIQCAAWGGPETSGLPTMDYYLSGDLMEAENAQDHYTEKLIRLPGSGVCFQKQHYPASRLEKSDFGAGDGPLIVCVQHAPKFAPRWDDLYRQINEATGQPIVIIDKPKVGSPVFKQRFADAGVNVKFLPYLGMSDYFGLLGCADVVLDTPGWNGGITTIHALQMGAPVITLPTELRRGRQTYCFSTVATVPGLIASSTEDYVDLVANSDRRKQAAKGMNAEAIFDDPASAIALNEFIRSVVSA
jgi:Fe-S-cluster containining protein